MPQWENRNTVWCVWKKIPHQWPKMLETSAPLSRAARKKKQSKMYLQQLYPVAQRIGSFQRKSVVILHCVTIHAESGAALSLGLMYNSSTFLHHGGWISLPALLCGRLMCFFFFAFFSFCRMMSAAVANMSPSGEMNCNFTPPDGDQDVGKEQHQFCFLFFPSRLCIRKKWSCCILLQRLVQIEKDAHTHA